MGKKKHKKKQKKAAQEEQAASPGPSPLHRIGQALLDQARSPLGRQVIATGLIVAASALARGAGRHDAEDAATAPPDMSVDSAAEPPRSASSAKPGFSEAAAFAGMALSALDQFIHRQSPTDQK